MKNLKPMDMRTNFFTVVTLLIVVVATVAPFFTPAQKVAVYGVCVVYMLVSLITAFVLRPSAPPSAQPAPPPAVPVSARSSGGIPEASLHGLLDRWARLLQQAESEMAAKQSEGKGVAYIRGVAYGIQMAVRDLQQTLGIPESAPSSEGQ